MMIQTSQWVRQQGAGGREGLQERSLNEKRRRKLEREERVRVICPSYQKYFLKLKEFKVFLILKARDY